VVISPLVVITARVDLPDLNDLLVILVLDIPSPPVGDGMFAVSGMGGPHAARLFGNFALSISSLGRGVGQG
jgi:hypothetical protein